MARRALLTLAAFALCLLLAGTPLPGTGEPPPAITAGDSPPIDFCREVIPVFTKLGCNQGACHGAQHGKGGFRQSLFGFDPENDYQQIVLALKGRRISYSRPEESLILKKPLLQVAHAGGKRLKEGSEAYRRLVTWIADGAPGPKANEPTLTAIQVEPQAQPLQPGQSLQLQVTAKWSDGKSEDVTEFAQYDSLAEGQVKVDAAGKVTGQGTGEGAVMIRYLGQAAVCRTSAPYGSPTTVDDFGDHLVDRLLAKKWEQLGLVPSPPASDAEFLRRVQLDLIGTTPTPDEVRAFLADANPDKRTKLVDDLLERPEYADYWTLKWGDLLRNNRTYLEPKGMWCLHQWLRSSFLANKPMDEFARELLTAQGSTFQEGPANFYRVGTTPADWGESAGQLFLGVRMQCAKCHHHPFEKWSQDDYYGLAACFARVGNKPSQEYGLFGRETVIFLRPNGEVSHPRKPGPVKPRAPEGPAFNETQDRREQLAAWLTARENPYFARNLVNRYWAYCFGRGLVEPIDDLRATNPASNEPLLQALTVQFIADGYDVKKLLRLLVTSRAYQLSSQAVPGNQADVENKYHTRYRVRRLAAEQLADALDAATGTREKYQGLPAGTRAIQLPDASIPSYLLTIFGRPGRRQACECERTATPNLAQALHLLNGDFLGGKIARQGGRVDRLFQQKKPLPELVEELYLATLCRTPSPPELVKALSLIKEAPSPRVGTEDLLWALVNSPEFLFNH